MAMISLLASSDGEVFGAAVAILVITVVILRLAAEASKTPTRRKNLRSIAARLRGTFIAEPGWGDRVEFRFEDCPATLSYHAGDRHESPNTHLHFGRPIPGILRLFPVGFLASLSKKIFWGKNIEFDDADFDRAFVVQGVPEAWIREVLPSEARGRIQSLTTLGQSLPEKADVRVDAGPAGVTIRCGRNLADNGDDLNAFLDHAFTLYARIGHVFPEGVEFLSAEAHVAKGDCPVCANPLGHEAHRCPRCATPHHSDCWTYYGGCAIYGCGRGAARKA